MTAVGCRYDEALATFDPGARARGARRAQHGLEDVLRLLDRVRCAAQHADLPGLPRPARLAAGGQRAGGRVGDPDRAGAELLDRAWCRFARKNYFYPDMPKNYQISQYDEPIAFDGWTEVEVDGETYRIEIERAHMEEDTGKSLHVGGATGRIHGADYSLLDYNRAGVPLDRDRHQADRGAGEKAPEVARAYVAMLRDLLRGLGVSDVRMEQGSLRCDANVSLDGPGRHGVRHPDRDQERELAAQRRAGDPVRDHPAGGGADRAAARSSRRPGTGRRTPATTTPGRSKETAEDYRYFPEPDLVPVAPDAGVGGGAAGHAARAAGRAAEAGQRRVGLLRTGDA